jgi:hypothetical protein
MIAMAAPRPPSSSWTSRPALDVVNALRRRIKSCSATLFAVIFVTHDMPLVSHFSDRRWRCMPARS